MENNFQAPQDVPPELKAPWTKLFEVNASSGQPLDLVLYRQMLLNAYRPFELALKALVEVFPVIPHGHRMLPKLRSVAWFERRWEIEIPSGGPPSGFRSRTVLRALTEVSRVPMPDVLRSLKSAGTILVLLDLRAGSDRIDKAIKRYRAEYAETLAEGRTRKDASAQLGLPADDIEPNETDLYLVYWYSRWKTLNEIAEGGSHGDLPALSKRTKRLIRFIDPRGAARSWLARREKRGFRGEDATEKAKVEAEAAFLGSIRANLSPSREPLFPEVKEGKGRRKKAHARSSPLKDAEELKKLKKYSDL